MSKEGLPSARIAARDTDLRLDHLIVGGSAVMRKLKLMVERIAPSPSAVMVQGPTGAGKEVVTEALHLLSARQGPLIAVNCAAIPADLLESELFGHEKGAFTGAAERRIGRVEAAHGGTLFLDEIGDMPPALQAKLLRVLETRRIQRLGGREDIAVDFRLVTATHRNLAQEVAQGRFRQDLYYRIAVFSLTLPALADRHEDIPLLLETMARPLRAQYGPAALPRFSAAALDCLQRYDWPGNVRELRNVFDRAAVLFAGQEIGAEDCANALLGVAIDTLRPAKPSIAPPASPQTTAPIGPMATSDMLRRVLRDQPSVNLRGYLQSIEIGLIEAALEVNQGCVAHAARSLRLKRTTMIEKMKKLGIDRGAEARGAVV